MTDPKSTPDGLEDRDFDAIYARHFAMVWRCLRGMGVPAAALDDAAQEVFLVVHRRLCDFRGESSLKSFLYGIVRNVAANQRRGDRRRGLVSLPADLVSSGPGPVEHAQQREAAEFVQRFLGRLDDKRCDVFVLALLEGLSMPEVAEVLGIPLNTAYTRLRSVRLDFQRALARERGSHE